jgi:hypothetical protein
MTSRAQHMIVFTKNQTADRFVTSGAHISQVVWPVNRVCKMCDLSAHAGQVIWPPVPFTHWRPSEANVIKINTDGGLAIEARKEGWGEGGGGGGVARSSSSFVAAWCKPYQGITDRLIAEVMALRDGVIFVQLWGYSDVVMTAWRL